MHPSAAAEMRAHSDTCAWSCPASVGDVWNRVQSHGSAWPGGFLGPSQSATASGTVRVAALLVQFQADADATTTGQGQFKLDGHGETVQVGDSVELMLNRADTYYRAVSYGRMNISYTVFDTVQTMASGMATYTASAAALKGLVLEAVARFDTDVDYRNFDAVVVFHAGTAWQLTAAAGDVPAQFFNDITAYNGADGVTDTVTHAIIMAAFGRVQPSSGETVTMRGTFCHEFGHALGLPDLYSTGTGAGGIGDWGLMATGNYAGRPQGDSPAWMDAWSREYLGWADTKVADSSTTITITKAESTTDSKIYKIYADSASNTTEYFLLEVREPTNSGVDSAPGVGMLIWHIDNTMGSISSNNVNNLSVVAHRRVDLEEADNSDVGSSSSTFPGTAAQPWPGSGNKTAFANDSLPNSKPYSGSSAKFALKSIALGSSVSFTTDFTDVNIGSSVKYPSTCMAGRVLSPWPRALSAARLFRDFLLNNSFGRTFVFFLSTT